MSSTSRVTPRTKWQNAANASVATKPPAPPTRKPTTAAPALLADEGVEGFSFMPSACENGTAVHIGREAAAGYPVRCAARTRPYTPGCGRVPRKLRRPQPSQPGRTMPLS
ncbi:hypothetical protein Arub01_44640 [Actinomadura rubrobrunea]|uniref:Uncharacterized protein n=1 Tax=Actinomadura rubrobrunea TaxID=115335 RepID=A0A9W6PXI0_9ACTN|nr:hypothetical protein Arub01_44640 [Actinomadura rubrobrunea]